MNTVTILKNEYIDLLKAEEKLQRLEAVGVDNWQGYDDAMAGYKATCKDIENQIAALTDSSSLL